MDMKTSTRTPTSTQRNGGARHHQIVIVGGGAAGIDTAGSLLARNASLDIAIIEPEQTHYYQPGWTMVGAGIFDAHQTARPMADVMPDKVNRIKSAVAGFEAEASRVLLHEGSVIGYD
jgi:sulfide:quinone oxidoreductase